MKTWILIVILIVLAAVFFISEKNDHSEKTFKSELVNIDTSLVDQIIINKKNAEKFVIKKISNSWMVFYNDKKYSSDDKFLKNILSQISKITAERVAAKGSNAWSKYEVADTNSIRVQALNKDEILADIYVGKFTYIQPKQEPNQQIGGRQPRGTMISYLRLAGENEVYAVNGYFKMMFDVDLKDLRNKTLSEINFKDISKVVLNNNDKSYSLIKDNEKWMINNIPQDSAKTVKYLKGISKLRSNNFVEKPAIEKAEFTLTVEGNNFTAFTLKAFKSDEENSFIISSSNNPGVYFDGSKSDLFEKAFVQKSMFKK